MATTQKNPPKRGRFSDPFLKKLIEGDYAHLIGSLLHDENLDIQLRDNYINVYYRGGNILCIYPKTCKFDKFYFYRKDIGSKPFPKSYIEKVSKDKLNEIPKQTKLPVPTKEEAKKIIESLDCQAHNLCEKLKVSVNDYLYVAKKVMDEWFESWEKSERNDQHIIALSNRIFSDKSDLVVVDLEYAVSTLHQYNKAKNAKGDVKVCRFDIIAVDRNGQLYVIELKQNSMADSKTSKANVEVHSSDFDATIGNDHDNSFIAEMCDLVEVKHKLGILSETITVDKAKKPIFAVAYSGKNAESFNAKYEKEGLKVVEVVPENNYLYLKLK